MKIITLTCKAISPMFIGNADVKNAELRPSTLEGSLRFWWRGVHPDLSEYELRKQETEFFGGSYMDKDDHNKTVNKPPSYRFLSVDPEDIEIKAVFIDVRNYSPNHTTRNTGKAKAIMPNSVFTIKLQIINNKEKVLALFKLASALGSLGKRSRRGAGAWKIEKINGENSIIYKQEKINEWINTINPNYKNNTNTPDYPYLIKYTIGGKTYTNQEKLRIKIMETAHYCKNHQSFKFCLGEATNAGRLSSPVYVSMIEDSEGVKSIISILKNGCRNTTLQDNFSKCILNDSECNNNC